MYGYPKYVSQSEKRAKNLKKQKAYLKKHPNANSISIETFKCTSYWAKAWNKNLESYSDYENRLPRGKSYLKTNAVLDIIIEPGKISGVIAGSSRTNYNTYISIDKLSNNQIANITALLQNQIESLESLLAGKFPKSLQESLLTMNQGLFPNPSQIHFNCNCPDSAYMCKHIACLMYATSLQIENNPSLLFTLRGIELNSLIKDIIVDSTELMLKNAKKKSKRTINTKEAINIFELN